MFNRYGHHPVQIRKKKSNIKVVLVVQINRAQLNATGHQNLRVHKMVLTALFKKDLLHKSQTLLPNKRQSMVLSCKIKAHSSVAQHRAACAFQKSTAKFQYWIYFRKSEIYLQPHRQSFMKNFLCGHKYIYKIQYFLLAGFLNDDFNFFLDFSYAEKKLAQQRSGCMKVCSSLFMCRNTSKGFKRFNNGTMTA